MKIYNLNSGENIELEDFISNRQVYYEKADLLKRKKNNLNLFGKFFIYKTVQSKSVKDFSSLSDNEKINGSETDLWVKYNRGNSEGHKWYVPFTECIT